MYIILCKRILLMICLVLATGSPQPGLVPFPMMDQMELEQPQLVQLDPREKQSYTEQAAKRKHCQRLTRYVRYERNLCIVHMF